MPKRPAKARIKAGRPPRPKAKLRRNRVVVLLTDAEHRDLQKLAENRGLPSGTVAYQLVREALQD